MATSSCITSLPCTFAFHGNFVTWPYSNLFKSSSIVISYATFTVIGSNILCNSFFLGKKIANHLYTYESWPMLLIQVQTFEWKIRYFFRYHHGNNIYLKKHDQKYRSTLKGVSGTCLSSRSLEEISASIQFYCDFFPTFSWTAVLTHPKF